MIISYLSQIREKRLKNFFSDTWAVRLPEKLLLTNNWSHDVNYAFLFYHRKKSFRSHCLLNSYIKIHFGLLQCTYPAVISLKICLMKYDTNIIFWEITLQKPIIIRSFTRLSIPPRSTPKNSFDVVLIYLTKPALLRIIDCGILVRQKRRIFTKKNADI